MAVAADVRAPHAKLYVSDALAQLFPVARVRQLVTEFARRRLTGVSVEAQRQLEQSVTYYGAKCMAFPAVWVVETCSPESTDALRDALEEQPYATALSLSTSILDDFLDGEATDPTPSMMLCYCLLISVSDRPASPAVREQIRPLILDLVDVFLTASTVNFVGSAELAMKWRRRIGNFHRLIAISLTSQMKLEHADAIVELAGGLGDWCSLLDDVLDLPQDLSQGQHCNTVLQLIHGGADTANAPPNSHSHESLVRALHRSDVISGHLESELAKIAALADQTGFLELRDAFLRGSARLPHLERVWINHWHKALDLYREPTE